MGVSAQHHALPALPQGNTWYTLCRRLGSPHDWSGQVRTTSSLIGVWSLDHPAHSKSLYWLDYPGPKEQTTVMKIQFFWDDVLWYCENRFWYCEHCNAVFFRTDQWTLRWRYDNYSKHHKLFTQYVSIYNVQHQCCWNLKSYITINGSVFIKYELYKNFMYV
jgi:hypothetical protein